MSLIVTCGVIDKFIIFAIIPGLVSFLYTPIKGNIRINDYPILYYISTSLSICLFIIPFLILKKRSKRKPIEHQKIMDEAFKKYKKKRCKRFYLLIVLAILDNIIEMIMVFNFINKKKKKSNHWTFDIIIINFISYFLLKIKLYKHHYLCIIIIAILDISLNIFYYINCNDTFIYILIDYTNELVICFSFCLYNILWTKIIPLLLKYAFMKDFLA